MKLTKISNLLMLGLALTLVSAGCKKKPTGVTMLPGQTSRSPRGGDTGLPGGNPIPMERPTDGIIGGGTTLGGTPLGPGHPASDWDRNPDLLKTQTIYFEFDKSSVKSAEQSKLDEVANYLKSNPNHAVLVEGNCDERGTEEYNRSLGERRALSAREYLVRLGIDPNRVDTVTYGEDKPSTPGHDESAWSKNRRDDFIVLTPKH